MPGNSLFEAMRLRFVADAGLVAEFGHDEAGGPHKFWMDSVGAGDDEEGAGVPVGPPYVVASVLGSSGPVGMTFARGFTRPTVVLLKTFAASQAEADRLGGLVNAALLNPSRDRPPLDWDGGRETASAEADDRSMEIPGRGVSGQQLYGRYTRFVVDVAGRY